MLESPGNESLVLTHGNLESSHVLKVPPAPLFAAGGCWHRQRVWMAEERGGTERAARGKGRTQSEEFRLEDVKAFSERRHSISARHSHEGYLAKTKVMPF